MDSDCIMEGKAKIMISTKGAKIFFNPQARFSRSVGVVASAAEGKIKSKQLMAADVFSATGVRGIRYFLESGVVSLLYLNDASPEAARVSEENAVINGILSYTRTSNTEANSFLASCAAKGERFDLVDIDPFGSPAAYLDEALSAARRDGLVAITATDLAPLCGLHRSAALRRYGSLPIHSEFCHEVASRILIHSMVRSCGRRSLLPEVQLTVFSEQYIRVYMRVKPGRAAFPHSAVGHIHHCFKCHHTSHMRFDGCTTLPECPMCGFKTSPAGPLWLGPLHSVDFIEEMERNLDVLVEEGDRRRLARYLPLFAEENLYPPYFFDVTRTADRLDIRTPRIMRVVEILRSKGFKASRTHFKASGVKTDASYHDFKDTVREALSSKQ